MGEAPGGGAWGRPLGEAPGASPQRICCVVCVVVPRQMTQHRKYEIASASNPSVAFCEGSPGVPGGAPLGEAPGGNPWGKPLGEAPGGSPWGRPLGEAPGGDPGRGPWGSPWRRPLKFASNALLLGPDIASHPV